VVTRSARLAVRFASVRFSTNGGETPRSKESVAAIRNS
jgi:hypothetical protein